ncbi:MAG: hypothetical protein BWY63_03931 [Chloroflexi bacterium ADurb.Bin360]|nr:MAG: hypothetical protein BWY63_03931 [Chloroflexi bacterium ADurb.Bin360]
MPNPAGPIAVTACGEHSWIVVVHHYPGQVLIEIFLALRNLANGLSLLPGAFHDALVIFFSVREVEALHLLGSVSNEDLHCRGKINVFDGFARMFFQQVQESILVFVDDGFQILGCLATGFQPGFGRLEIGVRERAEWFSDLHLERVIFDLLQNAFREQAEDNQGEDFVERHLEQRCGFWRRQPTFDAAAFDLRDGGQVSLLAPAELPLVDDDQKDEQRQGDELRKWTDDDEHRQTHHQHTEEHAAGATGEAEE